MLRWLKRKPVPRPEPWPLSMRLRQWDRQDAWTLADACCGTQIWGSTGSGKTTGSLAAICRSFLAAGFGGIFLTAKPEDVRTYLGYVAAAGRHDDVILFGPQHPARFNFIDAELKREDGGPGIVENLAGLLLNVSQIAERGSKGGGREDEGYWRRASLQLLRAAIFLLVAAKGTVTMPMLHALIASAPASRDDVGSDRWRAESFCCRCIFEGDAKPKTAEAAADFEHVSRYFLVEWAQLSDKTRSVILSSVSSTLDVFSRGVVRELLSPQASKLDMTMPQRGKIILVDMPVLVYGELGVFVQATLKHCFQLAQSRRDLSINRRPTFLVCDESHLLASLETDARFQTTARSSRTCVVYATQSISNYLAGGGEGTEAQVHSMLGNLQTQLFHQQTDTRTIVYAQELIGRGRRFQVNTSSTREPRDWFTSALGLSLTRTENSGVSESTDFLLQASAFHQLAKGGPPHWLVEAILYQAGKKFARTGKSYVPVAFAQAR